MNLTTRKRSAAVAKLPAAADLKHPTSPNKAKSTLVNFKDDDPFYDAFDESSENSDSDVSDYACRKRRKMPRKIKKRKGKPGPGPAPEAPEISDMESESDNEDSIWSNKTFATSSRSCISLIESAPGNVFSIKLDTGSPSPTILNFDVSKLIQDASHFSLRSPSVLSSPLTVASEGSEDVKSPTGLLKLPGEIRDRIYKLVLTKNNAVNFNKRENFEHSAQFLRVCKQVAKEGARFLYGSNAFHFERTSRVRGTYMDKEWKEVGFKDVRRFLRAIGPVNISHMRYLSFILEDAAPCLTADLTNPERMYVNDPVLHEIFRIIGQNTILEKLAIGFCGRAQVTPKDFHFLRAIGEVKTKHFQNYTGHYGQNKIQTQAFITLKSVMLIKDTAVGVNPKKIKHIPLYVDKPTKAQLTALKKKPTGNFGDSDDSD
jgi:hypothetical protein